MEKSNSHEKIIETTADSPNNSKKDLEKMVSLYLASNPVMKTNRKTSELEIRFGTNSRLSRPITKIDYENVVKQLYSSGFVCENPSGLQMLRIQNEYIDTRTGITKCSNIRAEIVGLHLVQEYCRTNSIQKILDMTSSISASEYKVKFTQKTPPTTADGAKQRAVDFQDYNFRVSYQLEQDYTPNSNIAKSIIGKWSDSKKCFRYINRVRFMHPTYPLFADISIIKGNKKTGRVPIPQYTIQDAGVFENIESYEVELEIDNARVGTGTEYNTPQKIVDIIRKGVRFILSGLQRTNYPISYQECDNIIQSYMRVLHGKQYQPRKVVSSDFIGPSSYTLQHENIIAENEGSLVPNIRKHYTVTDKADGERKLMFISDNGRIYLIDTNMNVVFTGTMTNEKTLYNSILDGEHILFDKTGKYINLYAAFDIYYVNEKSVRELAFMKIEGEEDELDNKYRLLLLIKSMKLIKPYSIMDSGMKKSDDSSIGDRSENTHACDFTIKNKEFYSDSQGMTIFQGCSKILTDIHDGIYQYNTDGLIFTPCNTGVGSSRVGVSGKLSKTTWDMSFKWKPAKFNTIDFLVSIRKDKDGKDEVHNIFQDGMNTTGVQQIVQYKTLILRCGFSERDHGFLNPMQDIIDDKIPSPDDIDNEDKYKPVPFQPTNPYDPKACFCNILLQESGDGRLIMKTEEGEYFEEDMIVEFAYDTALDSGWKWIPLRVRYDKTAELRSGRRNYGNAYHVANSNWHSIHNPITEEMISTGLGLPEYTEDEDVYYNRYNKESSTKGLRNFHNLYVKKKLIVGVSERRKTLIDFAVGKGGDLSKWREGKLGFVFGVDVSKDNINNHLDGACTRYLKDRKKYDKMHSALFVVGNSSLNIRSGQAFSTEKDKMITRAVFGNGPKDRKMLGEGVYKHYGIGQEGFNISSCQFALHYFFESPTTFHSFIRNVAECTSMGGHFIGTCYDGKTVFQMLKTKQEGEGILIMKGDKKIYEVTKMYNQSGFPDDEASLGYPINVYQETINKVFREYLVNFDYFVQIMEDYGFVLITKEEAKKMDLPAGTGLFSELFTHMQNEIRRNPRKEDDYGDALKMTEEERRISFMNRYFIFKKVRTVAAEKMAKVISEYSEPEKEYEDNYDAISLSKAVLNKQEEKEEEIEKEKKPFPVRKIKKGKLILKDFSPIVESPLENEMPVETPAKTDTNIIVTDKIVTFKKPANKTRKAVTIKPS
jgi:mRNA capping enzyme/mRNA capping enzyme, catalytic domain